MSEIAMSILCGSGLSCRACGENEKVHIDYIYNTAAGQNISIHNKNTLSLSYDVGVLNSVNLIKYPRLQKVFITDRNIFYLPPYMLLKLTVIYFIDEIQNRKMQWIVHIKGIFYGRSFFSVVQDYRYD